MGCLAKGRGDGQKCLRLGRSLLLGLGPPTGLRVSVFSFYLLVITIFIFISFNKVCPPCRLTRVSRPARGHPTVLVLIESTQLQTSVEICLQNDHRAWSVAHRRTPPPARNPGCTRQPKDCPDSPVPCRARRRVGRYAIKSTCGHGLSAVARS